MCSRTTLASARPKSVGAVCSWCRSPQQGLGLQPQAIMAVNLEMRRAAHQSPGPRSPQGSSWTPQAAAARPSAHPSSHCQAAPNAAAAGQAAAGRSRSEGEMGGPLGMAVGREEVREGQGRKRAGTPRRRPRRGREGNGRRQEREGTRERKRTHMRGRVRETPRLLQSGRPG